MTINPVDHPVMFETPELESPDPDASSEWLEHVPFAMLLVDLIRPRSIVELGTSTGESYCAFCQAVKRLGVTATGFAIAYGQGNEQDNDSAGEAFRLLREHHDPRYGDFSQVIRASRGDAVGSFADGSIDLLHVADASSYDMVRHDVSMWLPKMSAQGIIMLHGIGERRSATDMWRFWDELAQRYPSFAFHHGHGLGIVGVGSHLPEGFQQLLNCSDEQANTLRRMCFERGAQLKSLQHSPTKTQASADAIAAHIENANHERYDLLTSKVELFRLREQRAIEREHRRRAMYDSQIQSLEARVNELTLRLHELGWRESSRRVRAIKLARAALRLLDQKGAMYVARRALLWLGGKRGLGLPNEPRTRPAATPDAPTSAITPKPKSSAGKRTASVPTSTLAIPHIRDQHVPSTREFSGVSIVIPVFNALGYAQRCIASIYEAGADVPFEVIVVDNGSNREVLEWLRSEAASHNNFWFVSVSSNLGYARGINLGIEHARGEYLMLANSDILVTPHWLDSLVAVMEHDHSIGVISPLTNYVGHGPQVDPRATNLLPEGREAYAAMLREDPTVQIVTNGLIFFCVMVRKQAAVLLGGLSDTYALGNYEDDDFCMRARLAGYKLAIARNTFVYHFGTKTFTSNRIDHTSYMHRNLVRYLDMVSDMSITLSPGASRRAVTEPLVSVVVRTVDRPAALRLALTSLANQTFENFEVVVVCDAGPDLSQLPEEFSPYLAIRYVHNEHSHGRGEALNIGVRHAIGKYIAYLDDDDIVYPTHLETLVNAVLDSEEGTTVAYVDYNNALMTSVNGRLATLSRVPISPWTYSYDQLLAQNFLPIHTWLHDRQLWEDVGGFDAEMAMLEDWDFLIRAGQRRNFVAAKRITCEYRFYLSGSNSSITNRSRTLTAMQEIYVRYPASAMVEAHRAQMVALVQSQIASGAQIGASSQVDGHVSEQEKRQLLAEIGGFAM